MITRFTSAEGREIAMETVPGHPGNTGSGVVFLGGFRSNMEGSKSLFLKDWCATQGLTFTRFDYSGHGVSAGRFEDGAISDWYEDACAVISGLGGPQILVGSSMGGWISLLVARDNSSLVAGLVTIAAAPDFTVRMIDMELTANQIEELRRDGSVTLPSEYGAPYIFTQRLFDDGATCRVLASPLHMPFPVRMLQGTADVDVPPVVATELLDHMTGPNITLTLIKDADHRFSEPEYLAVVGQSVADILARV